MSEIFDTLLLLALPASGKSEVRTFLTAKNPEQFHMGETVQLDDYPYVHLQILVDEALADLGKSQVFHHPDNENQRNGPFQDPREISGLIHLLNDDYAELLKGSAPVPDDPARHLLDRFDVASKKVGAKEKFANMSPDVIGHITAAIDQEARKFYKEKADNCPKSLDGKTVVIEFARGGPAGDTWPLPDGFGYASSLPQLSPDLLDRAAILYIWVTPEESRRKNLERARPDGAGSILFHGTPEIVMEREYSRCDMAYLIEQAKIPGTVSVEAGGKSFDIPVSRFDNRTDLTTFLRKDQSDWTQDEINAIHGAIKTTCDELWKTYSDLRNK